jgi:hypothetical protein
LLQTTVNKKKRVLTPHPSVAALYLSYIPPSTPSIFANQIRSIVRDVAADYVYWILTISYRTLLSIDTEIANRHEQVNVLPFRV